MNEYSDNQENLIEAMLKKQQAGFFGALHNDTGHMYSQCHGCQQDNVPIIMVHHYTELRVICETCFIDRCEHTAPLVMRMHLITASPFVVYPS